MDIAGQFARGRIIFAAYSAYAANVSLSGGCGNALRKHTHPVIILERIAGRTVAAHDIVVKHALNLPALFFRHFGKVGAAVQPLLLAGDGEKNNGGRESMLADRARTFDRDSGAAAIVIGARSRIGGVLIAGIARIVMPRDQVNAVGLSGVRAFQNGIDVLDFSGLLDAVFGTFGLLNESVSLDFQAAVAFR